MTLSTANLCVAPDAAVDLQVHTTYSDGTWTPEALIDHLASEGFAVAAITDHDRVDIAPLLQRLAVEKQLPLLAAVEMTTTWHGEMTDMLCYGFNPEANALRALADDLLRRQQDNTRDVYEKLLQKGLTFPVEQARNDEHAALRTILDMPSAQQPHALAALVKRYGYGSADMPPGRIVMQAGCDFATTDLAAVVEAAHQSDAVCLIAHPGRGDGYTCFDAALLDRLRSEIAIDGFEVYYPAHSPEQIVMYLDYAGRHNLLTSAGSDSHGPDKKPIKYRAELCRSLLERLGIRIG